MSEQRDSEARGDDPLTCSKCGGPTKENGRWHPDIGAVYGYELGLAERDPAPDTPEVAERPEKCPTCGGAPDDPGYDEINAGDQTGRDYCPDPFHTPEDTSRVEEDEPIDLTTPVRTRARLAAWREVEGDISGYDSEGYQRMIDHWPVVDDPERLGEVDEGESRVETTSGIDAGPWQEHEGTRVAQAVIAEIDKAYARGYNDGVQAEEQPQPVASEEDRTRVGHRGERVMGARVEEKSEARKLAERIAALDKHDCVHCGKPCMNMTGHMASGSADGWIHSHGLDQRACERAASVDHRLAFAIAESALQKISDWAWLAFTEELEEDEWEALPQSVKDTLCGIYAFAADATDHRTYEGLCVEPYARAQEPTSGEES